MGAKVFINLENTGGAYYPGQVIVGNVTINTSSNVTVKGLKLNFHGAAEVFWTKSESVTVPDVNSHHQGHNHHHELNHHHGHHPSAGDGFGSGHSQNFGTHQQQIVKEYRNSETYLNTLVALPICNNDSGGDQELPAGFYEKIPFTYQLPLNLPSTCKLDHGSIQYFMTANLTMKKTLLVFSTESDETAKIHFSILGLQDLSLIHGVLNPAQNRVQEQFGSCCCSSKGEFDMDIKLARTGFTPGEPIMFQLNYNNESTATVKKITVSLTQIIKFITHGEEKSIPHTINSVVKQSTIPPNTNDTWSDRLHIPLATYLTDLGGCRIIHVRYFLNAIASASYSRTIRMEIPLTVGTMMSGVNGI